MGFRNDQIGFAMRGEQQTISTPRTAAEGESVGEGAVEGAVAGGVLGGILGAAAALLIPGIGPVVAGGVLATALGGAAVGAAAGGILGALTGMGVPEEEAKYYEGEFQSGRAILTINTEGRWQEASDVLNRYGRCGYDTATGRVETHATQYVPREMQSTGAYQAGYPSPGVTATRETLVCVFDNRNDAEQAVQELHNLGFADDDIGFAMRGERGGVAGTSDFDTGTKAGEGAVAGGVAGGVLGALAALTIPGVGPIVAGGALATALGGAAAGAAAGGLLGGLVGLGIPEEEARYYETEFQSGRALLTVRAHNRYDEVTNVLNRWGRCGYQSDMSGSGSAGTTGTTRYTSGGTTRPTDYSGPDVTEINP
jgi:hypothetical protein